MVCHKGRIDWISLTSCILAATVYLNSLKAGFVYDDSRAILSNQDILPGSPWSDIWTNDFWGTPLTHSGSHKSFRPLTTISFRINYYFSRLNPWAYHVTNVLLHALTTLLFVRVARIVFHPALYSHSGKNWSFISNGNKKFQKIDGSSGNDSSSSQCQKRNGAVLFASLLFAIHPIHTEAVAGIVGRADISSTALALTAFLAYVNHVKYRDKYYHRSRMNKSLLSERKNYDSKVSITSHRNGRINHNGLRSQGVTYNFEDSISSPVRVPSGCLTSLYSNNQNQLKSIVFLLLSIFLAGASMLAKENGVMVLFICGTYDFLRSFVRARYYQERLFFWRAECSASLCALGMSFLILFHLRLSVMGGYTGSPTFSKADNPTTHHPSFMTRLSTFLYLPVFNFIMLIFPYRLSYDWSMDAIPPIVQTTDPRNLITFFFYFALAHRIISSVQTINKSNDYQPENRRKHAPIKSNKKPNICSLCICSNGTPATHRQCSNNNSIAYTPPITDGLSPKNSFLLRNGLNGLLTHSSRSRLGFNSFNVQGKNSKINDSSNKMSNNQTEFKTFAMTSSSFGLRNCTLGSSRQHGTILLQLSFLIWPFLPATNLFFYVGFVVAERVLYMSSVGFCLLVGHGVLHLWTQADSLSLKYKQRVRSLIIAMVLLCLLSFSIRTIQRNEDWENEEKLYRRGIEINPPKSWGNLGNVLNSQGRTSEAEVAYRQALSFRANMADVHYNLGLVLETQGRLEEALTSYQSAIHFRPKLAPAYVSTGQVLTQLGRTAEAMKAFERCFKLVDDGVKDLRNHVEAKVTALLRFGKLLVEEDDDPRAAIKIYQRAVSLMPPNYSHAQSVYNAMGEALYRTGEVSEAETWFKEALKTKPDHIPAHLTYGKMLSRNKTRLLEAESWFRRAKKIAPMDSSVYHHYGQFLAIQGRHFEAAEAYVTAANLTPADYDIIVGAANALRQIGDNQRAEIYYEKAVALRPQESRAHMNLGAILHVNGKYTAAEGSYLMALELKPSDDVTRLNLQKLRQLQARLNLSTSPNCGTRKQHSRT